MCTCFKSDGSRRKNGTLNYRTPHRPMPSIRAKLRDAALICHMIPNFHSPTYLKSVISTAITFISLYWQNHEQVLFVTSVQQDRTFKIYHRAEKAFFKHKTWHPLLQTISEQGRIKKVNKPRRHFLKSNSESFGYTNWAYENGEVARGGRETHGILFFLHVHIETNDHKADSRVKATHCIKGRQRCSWERSPPKRISSSTRLFYWHCII